MKEKSTMERLREMLRSGNLQEEFRKHGLASTCPESCPETGLHLHLEYPDGSTLVIAEEA